MHISSTNIDFSTFDEKIILTNDSITSLGLNTGKMGICIYFYVLSRLYNSNEYESFAEKILGDVFLRISQNNLFDIQDGLSGIGLGINYLLKQKYVEGDVDEILRDIDDLIFTQLAYPDNAGSISSLVHIHLLFYLTIRLEDQKKGSETESLFKDLIIYTLNTLYSKIDISFFEAPYIYSMNYRLPLFLYVLGRIYRLNFYNSRIEKIIDELTIDISSKIPALNVNKLFLLWGLNALRQENVFQNGDSYIDLLTSNLDLESIITNELHDKNIFFEHGFTSVYFLTLGLEKRIKNKDLYDFRRRLLLKIRNAEIWELLKNDSYFKQRMGLMNGYCGASLLLNLTQVYKK